MTPFGPESDDPLVEPFWRAAREDRLVLPYDRDKDAWCWYPRAGAQLQWREVGGGATLVAWSVVRGPVNPLFAQPYAPALVTLDAAPGVRLVTRIVDCVFESLRCDMPLELCFRTLKPRARAEFRAPVFRPRDAALRPVANG
ncbi:MAG: OB-fold domain-containing protein [Gammaproteobacteria bacterium]|jgi:uncharacterized OB-fold protein|nr:OB-fold domain-containing protein [Gammaproteobacteria bacterium]MBP6052291.1 OB-fold domain-containing protein [Pseudomonadales bacterium]MBK6581697.1 OB-fold domain-containing protein [Gammaproteobacteria bacterium]MBK7170113.1 OB-fold domain-containing protein [Gammaproteobacteria bacterium]MBK7520530.1 OB-fold domain-containing protein [Gammaproteobacteria bacterium]